MVCTQRSRLCTDDCDICRKKSFSSHPKADYWSNKNELTPREVFKGSYLPFDILIEGLKLIIEVDGEQHFKQISNWKSPDETRKIDIYKSICAINKGYTVIRIGQEEVWEGKYNWKASLKSIIKKYDEAQMICLSLDDTLYAKHLECLENALS